MFHFVERMIVPYDLIAKIDSCFKLVHKTQSENFLLIIFVFYIPFDANW
jgi:hypothetical protein